MNVAGVGDPFENAQIIGVLWICAFLCFCVLMFLGNLFSAFWKDDTPKVLKAVGCVLPVAVVLVACTWTGFAAFADPVHDIEYEAYGHGSMDVSYGKKEETLTKKLGVASPWRRTVTVRGADEWIVLRIRTNDLDGAGCRIKVDGVVKSDQSQARSLQPSHTVSCAVYL
jgi:hypothetical protein